MAWLNFIGGFSLLPSLSICSFSFGSLAHDLLTERERECEFLKMENHQAAIEEELNWVDQRVERVAEAADLLRMVLNDNQETVDDAISRARGWWIQEAVEDAVRCIAAALPWFTAAGGGERKNWIMKRRAYFICAERRYESLLELLELRPSNPYMGSVAVAHQKRRRLLDALDVAFLLINTNEESLGEAIERRRGLWYGQDLELSLRVIETSCAEFHTDLAPVMAAAPAYVRLWRREQIDMLADFLDANATLRLVAWAERIHKRVLGGIV